MKRVGSIVSSYYIATGERENELYTDNILLDMAHANSVRIESYYWLRDTLLERPAKPLKMVPHDCSPFCSKF